MEYEENDINNTNEEEESLSLEELYDFFINDYQDPIIETYIRLNESFPYIFKYGESSRLTDLLLYCYGLYEFPTYITRSSTDFRVYNEKELDDSFYIVNLLISPKKYNGTKLYPRLDYQLWCGFCYSLSKL